MALARSPRVHAPDNARVDVGSQRIPACAVHGGRWALGARVRCRTPGLGIRIGRRLRRGGSARAGRGRGRSRLCGQACFHGIC